MDISFKDQLKIWFKVAINSFGGPAGQIAVIHKVVVEEKKLISEEQFLNALNFCMLLPGPEAQQLATYLGWLMNKWRGGLLSGLLFILPGFLSILLLSILYIVYKDNSLTTGIFFGIKPAIISIVLISLIKISKKSLTNLFFWTIALVSFFSLFVFKIPFPFVVIFSGILGVINGLLSKKSEEPSTEFLQKPDGLLTIKTFVVWLFVWMLPLGIVYFLLGSNSILAQMNFFFSKMSLVTFGGAYAALSYVAQEAVETHKWVSLNEMIDALALAESTPGPLIQSVQFVAFLGAYRFSDFNSPMFSAILASALTTWMVFAPSFLWIFTFAPYVEYLRGQRLISEALKAISAAVVGVIFNLFLWFSLKTLFLESDLFTHLSFSLEIPRFSSLDPYSLGLSLMAFFLLIFLKRGLFTVLALSSFLGFLLKSL